MFAQASQQVPLPLAQARTALDTAILDGGLVTESVRAHGEGLAFLMRVGPAGKRRMAKRVRVQALPSRTVGRRVTVPLRWQATGPASSLFPELDANLDLIAGADDDCCLLSVTGRYAPPLGWLGSGLDRTLLAGVADRTLQALLSEIAAKLLDTAVAS